jgi:putative membrane protein (TIGR04086 family)
LSGDDSRRFFDFESGTFREPADPRRPRGSVSFCPSTLDGIAPQRPLPTIHYLAVAAGVLVAATIASLLRLFTPPAASIFGIAAPLCGIALGGLLAGKVAKHAGLYHGALVGVGYVVIEAIGLAPAPFASAGESLTEGLSIIAGDALLLALAALTGWIAAPRAASSSSSDTGRGR